MTFKTKDGAHPSIKINVLKTLPKARYKLVLERIRNAIAKGRSLQAYGDCTPGCKSTSCSWGLCHESAETWPDAEDHIFPVDFQKYKRISHLRLANAHKCPLDLREEKTMSGCFWTCRVFSAKKGQPRLQKEEALALYDAALAKLK